MNTTFRQLALRAIIFPLMLLLSISTVAAEPNFFDRLNNLTKALSPEAGNFNQQQPQNRNAFAIKNKEPAQTIDNPVEPIYPADPIGITKKRTNLRAGPGTNYPVQGQLGKKSEVSILSTKGKWHEIQAVLNGDPITAWAYAPLITITSKKTSYNSAPVSQPSSNLFGQPQISYAGYSKSFQPVKQMLYQGEFEEVEQFYLQKKDNTLYNNAGSDENITTDTGTDQKQNKIKEASLLQWLEQGTLSIDQGKPEGSIEAFSKAENILKVRQKQSKTGETLGKMAAIFGEIVSGNEELQSYSGEGYERVLMLNYKSIAYLLQGDRKTYNVTRRAIDWQNIEKRLFEEKLRKVKEELAKKVSQNQSSEATNEDSDPVDAHYKALEAKALSVPSAYVNPFGYYVQGMVQEFESYDDQSLRDNAFISYKKALQLNPDSKTLQTAVKEMKQQNMPENSRLIHIVAADGFAPEKKVITYAINSPTGQVPIKRAVYNPVKSKVARIEVQAMDGKRIALLHPIADIEAISLRHQKDMEPMRQLRMLLTVASTVGMNTLLNNLGGFGQIIANERNKAAAPDMRSWMSLPSSIHAARIHLKHGIEKVKLVSHDIAGRKIASTVIEINGKAPGFIYARSLNESLYTRNSNKLWMVAEL